MTDEDWREQAQCKGKTELFFPAHRERPNARAVRENQARQLCATCPVALPCELASEGEDGFWAGKNADERGYSLANAKGAFPID